MSTSVEHLCANLPERLVTGVNNDARLVHRGRYLNAVMMLGIGNRWYRVAIVAGRIDVTEGAELVMPSCTFSLQATANEWVRFWQAVPPPGSHDLFALLNRGELKLQGNLQPFMANLSYFKTLVAKLRDEKISTASDAESETNNVSGETNL